MGPISGGIIYAFNTDSGSPPDIDGSRHLPDALALTDSEGKFSLRLPAGTYYLTSWKKAAGPAPGPPEEGDLHALSRDEKGSPVKYTVKSGVITDHVVLRQATVFKSPAVRITDGVTAITGTLTTFEGTPLADAFVQVYINEDVKGKPCYVSYKTGKDGKFIVKIDHEGAYYLAVRANYGVGRPVNGEILGIYGGEMASPVNVKDKSVTSGIDIKVGQFIDNKQG
ncbi:MAG: hypothetical protein HXX17_01695 [Geobacteraceae bacterium]|nr:hypothetical protein [Geobacteraceae bacterium]